MSRTSRFVVASALAALFCACCTVDRAGVDAAEEILPSADSLASFGYDEQSSDSERGVSATPGSGVVSGDDSFGAIGLLAPAFSGLGLETYSTSCDPFADPYGECL